ncbi:MAG: hypothetical protein ABI543_14865 [Ignavibacteria bacterium]
MKTKNLIITAVIGLILISFTGCSLLRKRVEKKETVKYTLNGSGKTSIHVENTNGRINVSNSNDTNGMITIEAEKIADVKVDEQDKPIENIKIKIDSAGSEINIETDVNHDRGMFHKGETPKVNYDIKVPANMKVSAENVNGTITISRITADVTAETVNGTISIFSCPGQINLSGVNGTIICNVDSVTAGIKVEVVNGSVKIGGLKTINADVNATTVNGKVKFADLTFSNLNANKKSLSGTLGKGGNSIRVESTNGSITFDANKIAPKKDDTFEFKIDFDDDDEPVKIIKKEPGETKAPENGDLPKAPVKTDSVKK